MSDEAGDTRQILTRTVAYHRPVAPTLTITPATARRFLALRHYLS